MRFVELAIPGVWLVEPEAIADERGFFARTACSEEFARRGLPTSYCQSSISFNAKLGTLRGMHLQAPPSKECKLVRCTQGAMHDVILDLREGSPSFGQSVGVQLTAANRLAVAVPHGCAHGFVTLADSTEVLYMMSEPQNAALARAVRWNDPKFSISWPIDPVVISERDAACPDFSAALLKSQG